MLNLETIKSQPYLISTFPKDRSDQSVLLYHIMVAIYILDLSQGLRKIKVNCCHTIGQESSRQSNEFEVPGYSGVHLLTSARIYKGGHACSLNSCVSGASPFGSFLCHLEEPSFSTGCLWSMMMVIRVGCLFSC